MVLRIGRNRAAAVPVALGQGAFIQLRPASAVDYEAARLGAGDAMRQLGDGVAFAGVYGVALELPAALDNAAMSLGVASLVLGVELALRCAVLMEGVENADGSPATITREALAELFCDRDIYERAQAAMLSPLWEDAAEGKERAISRDGAREAGSPIAAPAATPAPPAPLASAAPMESSAPN